MLDYRCIENRHNSLLGRCVSVEHTSTGGKKEMNGESRKDFAVALVSFAIGAAIAGVLGNSKAREKLVVGSKKLVENFRKSE